MANLHFVAAEQYENRVIQLGEHVNTVFNEETLGVDVIASTDILSIKEIEKALEYQQIERNLRITFHRTNEPDIYQLDRLLIALES